MNIRLDCHDQGCRLVFTGSMTYRFSHYMEDQILDAMHRFPKVEVDLSAVSEIDHCGVHLLGVIRNFGGKGADIVARSPAVEHGTKRILASGRGHALRGDGSQRGNERAAAFT